MKEQNNIQNESVFFEKHTVYFQKTKQQEWSDLQEKLNHKMSRKQHFIQFTLGIAASLLLALGLLMQFYEKSYQTLRGEQQFCTLPDGSKVFLNAETTISYKPLKWYFSREVAFSGEGFFEVTKGSQFTVYSNLGSTQVLGTSFNVFARKKSYKVVCITGKVAVQTQGKNVTLLTGEAVISDAIKNTLVKTNKEQEHLLAWRKQRLLFKAKPLREVFDALERQYNVYIAYYPNGEKSLYSGNISLQDDFEKNLSIICKTFEKKWEKSQTKEHKILYIIND